MDDRTRPLNRRIFLQVSGASAALPLAGDALAQRRGEAAAGQADAARRTAAPQRAGYRFFNAAEAAVIEAAVQRLIPPDELGPGALEAGVPQYIDGQLGGAWGAGERLYRSGPWAAGAPTQGYQLPYTPAELFRTALRGWAAEVARRDNGTTFAKLPGARQDEWLTALQAAPFDMGGVPSNVFFESLFGMTVEGYFCDPVYGGNRDMAAWKMIGFPGAYGAYYDMVDRHGVAFERPPRSLAEGPDGQVQPMPGIPATAPLPGGAPMQPAAQAAAPAPMPPAAPAPHTTHGR